MANLIQIGKHLKDKSIPYKLISLRSSSVEQTAGLKVIDLGGDPSTDSGQGVFTVSDVVKSGVDENNVVKTLIVRGNSDFVALAVRGKDRLDFKKVRKLFGSKSELAKPDEVEKVVGVPVGAVCPVAIEIPLYFDRAVMDLVHVNMGSGDLKFGLEMEFEDLLKAVGEYKIIDVSQ